MLQYHHAKFSRNKISPICKLCGEEDEDRMHFLLECKTLEENRKTQMVKLGEALEEARGWGYSNQDLVQIERATQHYCFVLHQKRTEILKNIM